MAETETSSMHMAVDIFAPLQSLGWLVDGIVIGYCQINKSDFSVIDVITVLVGVDTEEPAV